MGTVTKPMLLDETGQRIAAALETIAENGGGSGGGASGSPYVISYFDILDIVDNKYIDVTALVSVLEEKISNFNTLEVDSQIDFTTTMQPYSEHEMSFIKLVKDSDGNVDIYVNDTYVRTENTTINIKQILTLNASDIAAITFSNIQNMRNYVGSVYFGWYDNETPITVEEIKTIFK